MTEFTGGDLTEWYYLDVKVVDTNSNPIPGATVSVTNTNGPIGANNIHVTPQRWTKGLLAPQVMSSTLTGVDGHTPLPSDADNTLMIASNRNSTTFKYSITASKNGCTTTTVTNIQPGSTWLRTNPNAYQNTITIVLPCAPTGVNEKEPKNNIAIYPNPSQGNAQIEFELAKKENVQISIYNVIGEKLATVANTEMSAGTHNLDISEYLTKTGIYIIQFNAGNTVLTRKFINFK